MKIAHVRLTIVLLFLCMGFGLVQMNTWYLSRVKERVQGHYSLDGMAQAKLIQSILSKQITLSESLASMLSVMNRPCMECTFEKFSLRMIDAYPEISELSLYIDETVDAHYKVRRAPESQEGYLTFKENLKDFEQIKTLQRSGYSGVHTPDICVPCGNTLSIRYPMYDGTLFRGALAISLDLNKVYREWGMGNAKPFLQTALRNGEGKVIFGNGEIFSDEPIVTSFEIGGEEWDLAVLPQNGWSRLYMERLLPFTLSSILLVCVFSSFVLVLLFRNTSLLNHVQVQKNFYEDIFSSIRNTILILDADRKIINVNQPAMERMFGYRTEEVVGKKADFLIAGAGETNIFEDDESREVLLEGKGKIPFWTEIQKQRMRDCEKDRKQSIVVIQNISDRRNMEERLRTQIDEKEVLMNEIHHRVKNNLNIITSLLNLQKDEIESVEAAREAFEISCSRIQSIALVHESLYHTNNVSMIRMDTYIRNLISSFMDYTASEKHIEFSIDADELYLDITQAVPCGIIINELVTNSVKHAFPERVEGDIVISLKRDSEDALYLSVADNGLGLPEDFSFDSGSTLGITLVKILSEQLCGAIHVSKETGNATSQAGVSGYRPGTLISVVFPIAE